MQTSTRSARGACGAPRRSQSWRCWTRGSRRTRTWRACCCRAGTSRSRTRTRGTTTRRTARTSRESSRRSTTTGAGIAGVAPECRLLPVKVTNLFGQTDAAWLSEGIIWAADHGADVLNISIGLSSGTTQLRSAVQYAAAKGCVIVCSAGNTPTLPVVYPARYPETISVSATDNRDAILSISASGAEIDMAAPGWNVLSTWHLWSSPNTYDFRSGTSQAAPMVAGVAALIRATRPDLPGTTVRLILNASCRDLGSRGWDPVYGHGRIDAALAVANAKAFGGSSGGTATPGGECPADMNRDGVLSNADYFLFLNLFAARDPRADFALPHGVFNSDDFFSFSSAYIAGCGG
ncbi:MAG: S8 family serine peptidase [Phycisphaerales bacterium]